MEAMYNKDSHLSLNTVRGVIKESLAFSNVYYYINIKHFPDFPVIYFMKMKALLK